MENVYVILKMLMSFLRRKSSSLLTLEHGRWIRKFCDSSNLQKQKLVKPKPLASNREKSGTKKWRSRTSGWVSILWWGIEVSQNWSFGNRFLDLFEGIFVYCAPLSFCTCMRGSCRSASQIYQLVKKFCQINSDKSINRCTPLTSV